MVCVGVCGEKVRVTPRVCGARGVAPKRGRESGAPAREEVSSSSRAAPLFHCLWGAPWTPAHAFCPWSWLRARAAALISHTQ
jgi:hypothetical protein